MLKIHLLWVLLFLISLAPRAAEVPQDERMKIITMLNGRLLSTRHYRQQKLDNNMSARIFDEYFKLLDPGKLYFTQRDIADFAYYRTMLDDMLKAGDPEFAFKVYQRYLQRIREYRNFAEQQFRKGFNFDENESFEPDRRKLARPADDAGLRELWRKRLKNDVLYFRLLKRAMIEEHALDKIKDPKARKRAEAQALWWDRKSPEEKIRTRLRDIDNQAGKRDKMDILGLYLSALAQAYGPHSGYFTPKQEEDFDIDMKLSLSGIGATLTSDDGYTRVVEIVPGSPADRDGRLKAEDRVIAVTQDKGEPVDIMDMPVDKVVKFIRGPAGTRVTLTVLPGAKGRTAVPVNITITRGTVELKESQAKGEIRQVKTASGTKKIGVLTLNRFYMDFDAAFRGDKDYRSCSRDVERILADFRKQHVDALVMDMRANSGGSLPEAIRLSGLFIPSGPVVQVRQSNRSVSTKSDSEEGVAWGGPTVVLLSKLSASATEIFAGAMKDYDRAVLAGDTRTYGKGTVLDVVKLDRYSTLLGRDFPTGSTKYETAVFYRVSGGSVQQLGIEPDIVIPSLTEEMEIGELFNDNHLPWDAIEAVEFARGTPPLKDAVPELKKNSARRIAASPGFKRLGEDIARYRKYRDRKLVSLNENQRWKEYQEEKKAADVGDELLERAENGTKKEKRDDVVLHEAADIAADLADALAARKQVN